MSKYAACGGGCVPDRRDVHGSDYPMYDQNDLAQVTANPPNSSCLLKDLPPVYDQDTANSCTANAVLAAVRYACNSNKVPGFDYKQFNPSRLFLYYWARISKDPAYLSPVPADLPSDTSWAENDWGSSTRVAFFYLRRHGVCDEKDWPYVNYGTIQEPNKDWPSFPTGAIRPNPCDPGPPMTPTLIPTKLSASTQLTKMNITYHRIIDPSKGSQNEWQTYDNQPPVLLLKKCLADGYPFTFGAQFYKNYDMKEQVDPDTYTLCEAPSGANHVATWRHTMLAVGYDDSKRAFRVQNSWGEWFQDGGFFWMPYSWFENSVENIDDGHIVSAPPVTDDFWVTKCV